jgi:hypothetical protein
MTKHPLISTEIRNIYRSTIVTDPLIHEERSMFKLFAKARRTEWYPGQRIVHDRWGTPVGTTLGVREFRPAAEANDSVVNAMRWSVG